MFLLQKSKHSLNEYIYGTRRWNYWTSIPFLSTADFANHCFLAPTHTHTHTHVFCITRLLKAEFETRESDVRKGEKGGLVEFVCSMKGFTCNCCCCFLDQSTSIDARYLCCWCCCRCWLLNSTLAMFLSALPWVLFSYPFIFLFVWQFFPAVLILICINSLHLTTTSHLISFALSLPNYLFLTFSFFINVCTVADVRFQKNEKGEILCLVMSCFANPVLL